MRLITNEKLLKSISGGADAPAPKTPTPNTTGPGGTSATCPGGTPITITGNGSITVSVPGGAAEVKGDFTYSTCGPAPAPAAPKKTTEQGK